MEVFSRKRTCGLLGGQDITCPRLNIVKQLENIYGGHESPGKWFSDLVNIFIIDFGYVMFTDLLNNIK